MALLQPLIIASHVFISTAACRAAALSPSDPELAQARLDRAKAVRIPGRDIGKLRIGVILPDDPACVPATARVQEWLTGIGCTNTATIAPGQDATWTLDPGKHDVAIVPDPRRFPVGLIDPLESFAAAGGRVLLCGGYETRVWRDPATGLDEAFPIDVYVEGQAPATYFLQTMLKDVGTLNAAGIVPVGEHESRFPSVRFTPRTVHAIEVNLPLAVRGFNTPVWSRHPFYFDDVVPLAVYTDADGKPTGVPYAVLVMPHNPLFESTAFAFMGLGSPGVLTPEAEQNILRATLCALFAVPPHPAAFYGGVRDMQDAVAGAKRAYLRSCDTLRGILLRTAARPDLCAEWTALEMRLHAMLSDFWTVRNDFRPGADAGRRAFMDTARDLTADFNTWIGRHGVQPAPQDPDWVRSLRSGPRKPVILAATITPLGNSRLCRHLGRAVAARGITEVKAFTSCVTGTAPGSIFHAARETPSVRFLKDQASRYHGDTGLRWLRRAVSILPDSLMQRYRTMQDGYVTVDLATGKRNIEESGSIVLASAVFDDPDCAAFFDFQAALLREPWMSPYQELLSEHFVFQRDGYNDATFTAYRSWIEETHGSLNALNARWGSAHPRFEAIRPPCSYGEADAQPGNWYDWVRFRARTAAALVDRIGAVFKQANPAVRIMSGANQDGPAAGIDPSLLNTVLDFTGRHYTPLTRGMWYDCGLAPKGTFSFLTEYKPYMHGFGGWGGRAEWQQAAKMDRDMMYQIAGGTRGFAVYPIGWREKGIDREALIEKDGYPYLAFDVYGGVKRRSTRWDFALAGTHQRERADAAVYFPYETISRDARGAANVQGNWYRVMRSVMLAWDHAFESLHIPHAILDRHTCSALDADRFKLIALFHAPYIEDAALAGLERHVRAGGHLLTVGPCGDHDAYGTPSTRLADLDSAFPGHVHRTDIPLPSMGYPGRPYLPGSLREQLAELGETLDLFRPVHCDRADVTLVHWFCPNGAVVTLAINFNEEEAFYPVRMVFGGPVRDLWSLDNDLPIPLLGEETNHSEAAFSLRRGDTAVLIWMPASDWISE
jgi:hypothetical protein